MTMTLTLFANESFTEGGFLPGLLIIQWTTTFAIISASVMTTFAIWNLDQIRIFFKNLQIESDRQSTYYVRIVFTFGRMSVAYALSTDGNLSYRIKKSFLNGRI